MLYSRPLLVINFIYSRMYVSALISQFILPPPLPFDNHSLFSTSVTLFGKYVHLYYAFRFHIYVISYDIFLCLS